MSGPDLKSAAEGPRRQTTTGSRPLMWFAAAAGCAALIALIVAVVFPHPFVLPRLPKLPYRSYEREAGAIVVGFAVIAVTVVWVIVEGTLLERSVSARRAPLRDAVGIVSLLSVTMLLAFAVGLVVNETFAYDQPVRPMNTATALPYIAAPASWVLALLLALFSWLYRRGVRDTAQGAHARQVCWAVMLVLLLLPLVWSAVFVMTAGPAPLVWCVPASAFALWGIHLMQRHRRIPFRVLLAAFGWGAFVATGVGAVNGAYFTYLRTVLRSQEAFQTGLSLDAGIFEELYKGAGIAVIFLLGRRWFTNVASGVVIGAAVGLGFNFMESVGYMAGGAGMQFWIRQTVGMMTSHVAFSALVGAGFGIAAQARGAGRKRLAVTAGLLTAMCCHFVNNYAMQKGSPWFGLSDSPFVAVLVLYPSAILALQGPALAMYIALLRQGLKEQAAALAQELPGEAWSGHGAITRSEVPVLLSPRRRREQRIRAFRASGPAGWRATRRLQAAQIELAIHRWHRARGDLIGTREGEVRLREHVLRLKRERTPPRPCPA